MQERTSEDLLKKKEIALEPLKKNQSERMPKTSSSVRNFAMPRRMNMHLVKAARLGNMTRQLSNAYSSKARESMAQVLVTVLATSQTGLLRLEMLPNQQRKRRRKKSKKKPPQPLQ